MSAFPFTLLVIITTVLPLLCRIEHRIGFILTQQFICKFIAEKLLTTGPYLLSAFSVELHTEMMQAER